METSPDLNVAREATSLRQLVENRLREAITTGVFKPGQRLTERRLCELTGVGRTSIREALRQLEAEGLVTTLPHRGPVVSTISTTEAEQLYAVRALLEGFAGRECARWRDPKVIARLAEQLEQMRAVADDADHSRLLAIKTEFYAVLLEGCGNPFIQRFLNMLLNRITLLRLTSMSRRGRIKHTLAEMAAIVKAIRAGDQAAAEHACTVHVQNASAAALDMLEQNRSETASEAEERHDRSPSAGRTKGGRV